VATTKHLLILANSIKHWPGVCIAGREIYSGGSYYQLGAWIRPVSQTGEGELSPSETTLTNGKLPTALDFVQLNLVRHMKDRLQPENWLNDDIQKWQSVNSLYQKPPWEIVVETPSNIWVQRDERTDRVSPEYLKKTPPAQSLYLVHVPTIRAKFEWNEWDGRYKQRRRAVFKYRGVDYELNITDPKFSERYRSQFPAKGQPANVFDVSPPNGCYLCVSLAPEFNGFHYKVVASIFET
jgi:hypothetical protein